MAVICAVFWPCFAVRGSSSASFELECFELAVERIFDVALVFGALTGQIGLLRRFRASLFVYVRNQRLQCVAAACDFAGLYLDVKQKFGTALFGRDAFTFACVEQLAPAGPGA